MTNFPLSPLALVMSKISIEHLQKQLEELSSINMVLLAQLQNISKNKDSDSKPGTDSDDSCPSSPPRLRRKVLTRKKPVPVFESDSEDDFSPSLVEKTAPKRTKPTLVEADSEDDFSPSPAEKSRIRKRKLKYRPNSISPILKNKELFGSQRSTTPDSTSADSNSPTSVDPPSNQPILITSSSSEEEEEVPPNTPPERITELERRKKMMDLGEEAIRISDFASGQVFRCPRVVSTSDEEESVSGVLNGTINTDQTLSDDPTSTTTSTKAADSDSDEEIMIVRRKKKPPFMSKISTRQQKQKERLRTRVLRTQLKNPRNSHSDTSATNSETASDEPGPSTSSRPRRKAPKRANKPAVLESNSEDDFSPSPIEKSRKRKLKRRPCSISPILNNKELFDSQRSTTPESADSPSPLNPPSTRPIPSTAVNTNDLITSSSEEEEELLPNTPPERVTELERRRKQRDLCEQAVRRRDFASGQVIVNPRVVSSDEEEKLGGSKKSGASTSTIDTDATLSDDPPSTKGGKESDEESLVVNRRKRRKFRSTNFI
eukprot:sb/3463650/